MLKGVKLLSVIAILSILLTGCFKGEQSLEEMDAPDVSTSEKSSDVSDVVVEDDELDIEEVDEAEEAEDIVAETVARQLYLIDANGMVAEQTVELPNLDSQEVATQVLEHLVKDGPVTSVLPNGFQAVLPEGTEVLGINLQEDGTMIVDVSEEFSNYESADELKILQAMTHTLTQFENVDKIQLWINGFPQSEMPVNGTPIGEGYSRSSGINVIETDTLDLLDSQAVTMYYPVEHNEKRYYVPVTQHVNAAKEEVFSSIVQALINGPGYNTNVTNVFNPETLLMDNPTLEKGILELVFSEAILKDIDKAIISDEVMETLVRTLTEQHEVEGIKVKVKDMEHLNNENGEQYSEPVTNQTFQVEKI